MTKLPVDEKETVVDVNLKHVIIGFISLSSAALTIGVSVVILKDYAKYKRQKALIDAATHLLLIIQHQERTNEWTKKKQKTATQSSSPIKK